MSISHLYLRSQLRCSFLQETCPNRPWRKASLLSWAPKVWSLPFSTYHFLHFMLTCVLAPLWVLCGEGNGTPLQYSCLENPMDGGARWAAVHGIARSQTRLSDFTFTFYFHALGKEMATHSSVLAWRIPGTGEPGGLPSLGSHRVGHDWSNLAAAAAYMYISLHQYHAF